MQTQSVPGASLRSVIAACPLLRVEKEEEGRDDVCAVCLEGMEAGQRIRRLGCGHAFHDPCCVIWLVKVNCCPLCRVAAVREGEGMSRGGAMLAEEVFLDEVRSALDGERGSR